MHDSLSCFVPFTGPMAVNCAKKTELRYNYSHTIAI